MAAAADPRTQLGRGTDTSPCSPQNFPPSLKYVALFPSSGESPLTKPVEPAEGETDVSRRAKQAYERAVAVREKIVAAMESGELSKEPEVELEKKAQQQGEEGAAGAAKRRVRLELDEGAGEEKKKKKSKSASKAASKAKGGRADDQEDEESEAGGGIQGDDFFASDDDSE